MAADRSLRKQPQQDRSRRMVERIVDAGRTVLNRDGYERLTTNRVADEAGISPGSLYQYFPDKTAILDAVVDRYSHDLADQLAALVRPPSGPDPTRVLRETFGGLLDVLEANREYVRLVSLELPRAQLGERTAHVERRVGDLVGAYLNVLPNSARLAPAGSAWFLVRLVEQLSVSWVLEQPPVTRDELVEELTAVTVTHLRPSGP